MIQNDYEEFQHFRSLLDRAHYNEVGQRAKALYDWLLNNEATKPIIRGIMEDVPLASEDGDERNTIRAAASPKEIAAAGIQLMDQAGDTALHDLAYRHGIRPPYSTTKLQDYSDTIKERFIDPALDYIDLKFRQRVQEEIESRTTEQAVSRTTPIRYPLQITDSLARFSRDHPDPDRTAFVMMKFGDTSAHQHIVEAIRSTLKKYGIEALRADDKEYNEDLFPNILTYAYGCGFGIAVYERLEADEFNPNVSLEVGYMMALRKNVCLLKDRTLKGLNTDLVGKLYRQFDPQDPAASIPGELERWLTDKDIIT